MAGGNAGLRLSNHFRCGGRVNLYGIKIAKEAEIVVAVGAVGLVAFFAYEIVQLLRTTTKAAEEVGKQAVGLVTGDNFITQNQHTLDGEEETAYQGKGVLGTLGAATNSVSGGGFASIGESVGGWIFDLTHPNAGK